MSQQAEPSPSNASSATPLSGRAGLCYCIASIAMLGSVVAAWLVYSSMIGHAAGCDVTSGDCDSLLAGRWGNFLGVPISIPGLFIYLFMAIASLVHRRDLPVITAKKWWLALAACSFMAQLTGAWFFYVQLVLAHAWCPYCSLVHTCGALIAALLLWAAFADQRRRTPQLSWVGFVASKYWNDVQFTLMIAVLGVTLLITAQSYFPVIKETMSWQTLGGGADIDSGPGTHREISILAGRVRFKPHEMPSLGDADAPFVMVYLYDYTCPGCRAVHRWLQQARARYGKQLVIVTLPVPLNSACNPMIKKTLPRHRDACDLAKFALALWRIAPEKFDEFDAFLIDGPQPPTLAEARQKAEELIGPEKFAKAISDPWPSEQIARNAQLLKITGEGAIPRIILGKLMISSTPRSAEVLFEILEKETKLKPAQPD